ncbi:hypothetical protein [Halomonas korlensis]|uniref:Uncharacterized protein n=1 Tax=Halomonas korlensis TaxID=463301 RepID=A0A1I7J3H6_9GAMM|nr:hypothetical protein [Halomonas korlensis]SFU79700.1 hypothetical protein SAMN04487955_10932 [Halomonas korlensis]
MGIVTSLRQKSATAPQLDAQSLAIGYLFEVRWECRHSALAHCTRRLTERHDMPAHVAEREALQAYAALESVNHRMRVDIAATTSDLVMLRDAENRSIALTVTDLRRLVDQLRRDECLPRIDPERFESAHILEH